jgi:hypothetical protein
VHGGGGLYAWGSTNGVAVSRATCGTGTVTMANVPAAGTGGAANRWAFRIDGLPVGVAATLRVYYIDTSTMPPVERLGATWTFTPA